MSLKPNIEDHKASAESENIQVYLRLRPRNESEVLANDQITWEVQENSIVDQNFRNFVNKQYTFNSCYSEETGNEDIYEEAVRPIILSSLDGINGTVFMYGQTGSGKTHTMLGDYSKEVREADTLLKRSGSTSKNRYRSGSRGHYNTTNTLKRNSSFGHLPNKMNFGTNSKASGLGLQKQMSAGNGGLPPRNSVMSQNEGSQGNKIKFEDYIRNCKQYNITPRKGAHPLTRNKSESKLNTVSTIYNEGTQGVLIYSLNELFSEITTFSEEHEGEGSLEANHKVTVTCSYFEIYNDTVYDLLSDINDIDKPLLVCEDSKKKDFYVKNCKQVVVDTLEECMDILKMGEFNRHYAATSMNHQSSRSHTIFRLFIQNTEQFGDEARYTVSKESILNFIDLAGSEKVSNHHNSKYDKNAGMMSESAISSSIKDRVNEGKHINKSLFFLTQVISMKAKGKKDHIPFRNSPLTKILRSSLGGNSRTAIILCACPTESQYEQSLSTLRFGHSAKQIENKISANIVKNAENENLKAVIHDYENKLKNYSESQQQISELEKQKIALKERLIMANRNNIGRDQYGEIRKANFDHAEVHWRSIGILNSHVEIPDMIDVTKVSHGWKVATCEISQDREFTQHINRNYINKIKQQNHDLKTAAKDTKKYAEQIKNENDKLREKLEKANKKIKSIELAKGFEKCSDDLLNKWEKIFTNCLVQVSKEKGKREAQKEFKSFKSEFKKVISLNSNLQAQIEAMSSNGWMQGANAQEMKSPSEFKYTPSQASCKPPSHDSYKTAQDPMKENLNMYLTSKGNNQTQKVEKDNENMTALNQFPDPPFVSKNSDPGTEKLINTMLDGASSNGISNNEIESIIMSQNSIKPAKRAEITLNKDEFENSQGSNRPSIEMGGGKSTSSNNNQLAESQEDVSRLVGSYILENSTENFEMSGRSNQEEGDYSPVMPMNLQSKLDNTNKS